MADINNDVSGTSYTSVTYPTLEEQPIPLPPPPRFEDEEEKEDELAVNGELARGGAKGASDGDIVTERERRLAEKLGENFPPVDPALVMLLPSLIHALSKTESNTQADTKLQNTPPVGTVSSKRSTDVFGFAPYRPLPVHAEKVATIKQPALPKSLKVAGSIDGALSQVSSIYLAAMNTADSPAEYETAKWGYDVVNNLIASLAEWRDKEAQAEVERAEVSEKMREKVEEKHQFDERGRIKVNDRQQAAEALAEKRAFG